MRKFFLRKWFKFVNQGEKILDLVQRHLKIVKQMADQTTHIPTLIKSMDWRELEKISGILDVLESEADHVEKSAVAQISEGSYFGGVFGELLLLIDKVDNIADSAKDAMKTLTQRKPDRRIINSLLKTDDLEQFITNCRDAVYALDEAVKGLNINKQTALEKVRRIKECEEDADLYKSRLIQDLFRRCRSKDILGIIQVQNFINTADEIADNAEDASDIILVLIARGYG